MADINRSLQSLELNQPLDSVRGLEGDAAHNYFSAFDHLIVAQKKLLRFRNATAARRWIMLIACCCFFYTLLMHDCRSALESVGLDPAVGFLHRDRGRPGLALDIMEEFRPFLADRLALSLMTLRQVQNKGFNKTEAGAVMMSDETRKALLVAYQERKQEEIYHPFLEEKVTIGLLFTCRRCFWRGACEVIWTAIRRSSGNRDNVRVFNTTAHLFSKEGLGDFTKSVIKIPLYPPLQRGNMKGKFFKSPTLNREK